MSRKRNSKPKRRKRPAKPEDPDVKKEKYRFWTSLFSFAGVVVRLFL